MSLRVALVGLGRMGHNHWRVLRETEGVEVAAVVDTNAGEPRDLGSTRFLRSTRDLRGVDFDAAVVATPTETHRDVALELVAMGKHLLVEKPITSSFGGGRELLQAAKERGVELVVSHVERFNPAVRKLAEVIQAGLLGTPIHFAFTRVGGYPDSPARGNNVILDLATHDIDVLRNLAGAARVEHSMCHGTWREGVVDTAEILLASRSGASATVHVNWITPTKIRTIRVTGSRGVCHVDYILQTCELLGGSLVRRERPDASFESIRESYRTSDRIEFGVPRVEPLRAQAEQFRRFLQGGGAGDLCTGADAAAAVLLAERALETGRRRPSSADEDWV
jgi:UDP-N-acetylglucosamine 3-dehydrogenase